MKKFISQVFQAQKDNITQYKAFCLQQQLENVNKHYWVNLFPECRYSSDDSEVYIIREKDKFQDEITLYINSVRRLIITIKGDRYNLLLRICEIIPGDSDVSIHCADLLTKLNEGSNTKGNYTILVDETSAAEIIDQEVISFYYCHPLKKLDLNCVFKVLKNFVENEMSKSVEIVLKHQNDLLNQQSLIKEFSLEEPEV